jgi:hypothetical protein
MTTFKGRRVALSCAQGIVTIETVSTAIQESRFGQIKFFPF